MTLRKHALRYARDLRWPIFPVFEPEGDGCSCGRSDCASPGKHPRSWRGWRDATIDPDRVRAIWAKWPGANIGLATHSGLVLDIDGAEGERDLARLERRHGSLPCTVEAATSKGRHLFYRVDSPVPSGVHVLGSMQIDARGMGGYVLLAPSRHVSGHVYRWRRDPFSNEVAMAPDWVCRLLRCISPPAHDRKRSAAGDAVGAPHHSMGKAPNEPHTPRQAHRDLSRSGIDARRVLDAMRSGASDAECAALLERTSSKAREEGDRYVERTIAWARAFVGEGLVRVRVRRARLERLDAREGFAELTRIRCSAVVVRRGEIVTFDVVAPSATYDATIGDNVSERELRRMRDGADLTHLFPPCLVSRDERGRVRFVRRAPEVTS